MNQLQGHFRWAFRTYLAGNLKLKLCRSQQPKKILQAATAATQQRQGKASNYYIYIYKWPRLEVVGGVVHISSRAAVGPDGVRTSLGSASCISESMGQDGRGQDWSAVQNSISS